MRADELNESRLPTKIERDHQTVVSSRDIESDALAIQRLALRSRSLDIVHRGPVRGPDALEPTFQRHLSLRVSAPKADERVSRDYPHTLRLPCSHSGNNRQRR